MDQNEKPMFHSAVVFVDNIEISKKFYIDILGQEIEMDFGRCVGFVRGFTIWDYAYALRMMELDDNKEDSIGKRNVELYFEISDLDLFYNKLKKEHIEFVHSMKEQPWGQRCIRIYDPDRHILEIGEPMSIVIQRFSEKGLSVDEIVKKTMMPLDIVNNVLSN